jgi:TonB family protein
MILTIVAALGLQVAAFDRPPTWEMPLRPEYPELAMDDGRPGWADLRCRLTVESRLTACEIVGESVPELGFGEAALQAAPAARLSPAIRDGQPVEISIVFRLHFRLADNPIQARP